MEAPQGVELTGTNGGKAIILHHPGFRVVARIASFGWFPAAGSVRNASQDFSRPLSGSRTVTVRSPRFRPGKVDKICGGHGQGETPGPIPNPEAKALHGDGTAPERVWESSAPPLHTIRFPPVEPPRAPGGFLFFPHARAGPTAGRTGREKRGRPQGIVHVPFLSWIAAGGTRCIHQVRE